MRNEILISIIIPIYNMQEYISECINSVIHQTWKNMEIILVDDGSTDKCPEICDEYAKSDARIKVIHKVNGGISDARNAGLEIVNGFYICFVDADDYIMPNMVEKLYESIQVSNQKIAICGFVEMLESGKKISHNYYMDSCISKEDFFKSILSDENLGSYLWNKMYCRELFYTIRFPQNCVYEDIAVMYKLIDKCEKIIIIQDILYVYRRRNKSISHTPDPQYLRNQILSVWERNKYIKENYPQLKSLCTYNEIKCYIVNFNQLAKNNYSQYDNELECYYQLIRGDGFCLKILKSKNKIRYFIMYALIICNYKMYAVMINKLSGIIKKNDNPEIFIQ